MLSNDREIEVNVQKINKRLVIFIVVFPSLFLSLFDSTPGVDVAGHIGGLCVGLTLGSAYAFEDSRLNA